MIPALEDEIYEDGDDDKSLPVHRAPRSSSPDIPVSAQLLLREPAFAEASVDLPLEAAADPALGLAGDFDDEPSAEVNDRIAQMLGADQSLDLAAEGDRGLDGGSTDESDDESADESDHEIELQIELEADAGEDDDELAAPGAQGYGYDDRDDPDVLCSNGVAHTARSSDEDYEELRHEARDRDETDEDASWWMRVDASAIDQLPLPQELELDDLPTPGVISGTAGGATLQQRWLTAMGSPTEVECSCGHDCDQREEDLRELFRELSAAESRTLHLRFSLARHEDALALAFAALPRQHRARLLDFLDQHARRRVLEGANWRVIRNP